jgi:DNA-binding GntR family transcriptional regulator
MAAAVEKAYFAIREGIIRGAYGPGDHLTANDLATANGLSRTPVREAMRRLHTEALIRFVPHRGAFVTNFDDSDIEKIYDLRILLEGHAAEAAARNATPQQLENLGKLAEQMRAHAEQRTPEAIENIADLNNAFHKLIVESANNAKLEAALTSIVEVPLVLRTFRWYGIEEMKRSAAQHLEMVAAFRARDSEWAKSVMVCHIRGARHVLLGVNSTKIKISDEEPDLWRE